MSPGLHEDRRATPFPTPGCAIEASGHTFGGNRDELFRQVEAGLDWISRRRQ